MNKSLYKISEEYLNILADIEENEGIMEPEHEEALKVTEEQLAEKTLNYSKVIKMYESQIDFANKEIERINKIKASKERMVENMKKLLLFAVLNFGQEGKPTVSKVTGKTFRPRSLDLGLFKLSAGRYPKVEIIDEEKVDTKYVDYSISIKKLSREDVEKLKTFLEQEANKEIETIYAKMEFNSSISKTKIKEDFNPENKGEMFYTEEVEQVNESGQEVMVPYKHTIAYYNEENYSLKIS